MRSRVREHALDVLWLLVVSLLAVVCQVYAGKARGGESARPETESALSGSGVETPAARFVRVHR